MQRSHIVQAMPANNLHFSEFKCDTCVDRKLMALCWVGAVAGQRGGPQPAPKEHQNQVSNTTSPQRNSTTLIQSTPHLALHYCWLAPYALYIQRAFCLPLSKEQSLSQVLHYESE